MGKSISEKPASPVKQISKTSVSLLQIKISVEMVKSIQEKLVKTVLKMLVNVLLSVEMEKENPLKTVLIVLLMYLFVPLRVEMEKSIQEKPVMMLNKMEKTKNVL